MTEEQVNSIIAIGLDDNSISSFFIQTEDVTLTNQAFTLKIDAVIADSELSIEQLTLNVELTEK